MTLNNEGKNPQPHKSKRLKIKNVGAIQLGNIEVVFRWKYRPNVMVEQALLSVFNNFKSPKRWYWMFAFDEALRLCSRLLGTLFEPLLGPSQLFIIFYFLFFPPCSLPTIFKKAIADSESAVRHRLKIPCNSIEWSECRWGSFSLFIESQIVN